MAKYAVGWVNSDLSPRLVDERELNRLLLVEWGHSAEMSKEIVDCLNKGETLSLGLADVKRIE